MVEKKSVKKDYAMISYILGIISIVMALVSPVAGLVLGIIGLAHGKKQEDELSVKARKYNIIGIGLSIISLIIAIIIYLVVGSESLVNF